MIERRTIEAISPKIENVIDRDIFFICKNGCTENEKKGKKPEACFFYAKHRKTKLCLLDIQRNARRNFVNIGIKKFEIKENGPEG